MAKRKIEEDKIKIYYFHGFGSDTNSTTGLELKSAFPNTEIIDYDTSSYEKSLAQFKEFFKGKRFDYTDLFIGSSLGGYWANRFCQQFGVQTILINPSLEPDNSLKKFDGKAMYSDGKIYKHKPGGYPSVKERTYPRVVFIGKKDDVVDYKYTEKLLKAHCKFVYLANEGHRLNDLKPVLDMIPKIMNNFS